MQFTDLNLNKPILNALDDLGYTRPTTIQYKVFAPAMSGKDICGIAQTGTGKTLAYLLPLLRQFVYSKEKHPQFLVLVPTRELAVQVAEMARKLAAYMSFEVFAVYGGVNMNPQMEAVKNNKIDLLVATPGRLYDIALSGALRLKHIKKVVIDEMDEMLNLGFRTQLRNIFDLLPKKKQCLLFSATLPPEVEQLIDEYFEAPERLEAAPAGTPIARIRQMGYRVPNFYTKINLLERILQENPDMKKVLVFVATKGLADELFEQLDPKFPEQVGVIHSNKDQNFRFNAIRRFQEGSIKYLIATDIIARGMDIADVSHVISFDTPEVPENYIHRIGRTGRADKDGTALLFTSDRETERLAAIEALMNYTVPQEPMPEDLVISERLSEEEMPRIHVKEIKLKIPADENRGAAFHEKLPKNQKVNFKESHASKMRRKYGKPLKRRPKR